MLTGVLDANMAIGLAKGGVFGHLRSLYTSLYIPAAVAQEVITQGQGRTGAIELSQALGSWISEVAPDPQVLTLLPATLRSVADRQLLAVARSHGVDHVLTNDGRLIQQARRLGLTCVETPALIVLFKRRGLVIEVRPVLDRMIQQGFGIAPLAYQQALQAAGE